jgi:hypothetical protein
MRYVSSPLWKASASPDEMREVARLDRELAELRKRAKALAKDRYVLTNRLTVRARDRASRSNGE